MSRFLWSQWQNFSIVVFHWFSQWHAVYCRMAFSIFPPFPIHVLYCWDSKVTFQIWSPLSSVVAVMLQETCKNFCYYLLLEQLYSWTRCCINYVAGPVEDVTDQILLHAWALPVIFSDCELLRVGAVSLSLPWRGNIAHYGCCYVKYWWQWNKIIVGGLLLVFMHRTHDWSGLSGSLSSYIAVVGKFIVQTF